MNTNTFKHVLPCTSSVPSSSDCPGPHQLPPLLTSAFTLPSPCAVGCPTSLSHIGKAKKGREGQKSRGITETLTHKEGDKGPKSVLDTSCLLISAFPMTVSSPAGMDERSASCYSAAILSPPSHVDAHEGSFKRSTALPRGRYLPPQPLLC